jgi:hypothetical protein
MVGLDSYVDGYADAANGDLIKAMVAGQITGRDTTNLPLTQEPLKLESLDSVLKVLDFRTQDIRLYNAISKKVAYNTVEEYIQQLSYGVDRGGFYDEGELSDTEDSVFMRRAEHIKYIQVTGEVTIQAQLVRSYVDAMKQAVNDKMMWVLRKANSGLTKGDADVIPQEFNSLYKQHQSVGTGAGQIYADNAAYYDGGNVIDLRGASLKQETVEQAAVRVDLKFGTATDLFAPTTVISTLSQDYYNRQRFFMTGDASAVSGNLGVTPSSIATTLGSIRLNSDKFMKAPEPRLGTAIATSAQAPATPTLSVAAVVANDPKSKYVAADAGNVFYAAAAINKKGESPLSVLNTAVAVVAGASVDLTITAGVGANQTSGYMIYRTEKTTASDATGLLFYPIFKVSVSNVLAGFDGAGAGKARDTGIFLPNTEQCFVAQMDDQTMYIKQLAPISKLDLAVNAPSRRFMVFHYMTPVLVNPNRMVRIINCGKKLSA